MPKFNLNNLSSAERVKSVSEYLGEIATTPVDVCLSSDVAQHLRDAGCPERSIECLESALDAGICVNGLTLDGVVYVIADNVESLEQVRRTYVHERQHILQSRYADTLVTLSEKMSKDAAIDVIDRLSHEGESYRGRSHLDCITEAVAYAIEEAYSTADGVSVEQALRAKGVTDYDFITAISDIDHEQRKDDSLSLSRITPSERDRKQGSGRGVPQGIRPGTENVEGQGTGMSHSREKDARDVEKELSILSLKQKVTEHYYPSSEDLLETAPMPLSIPSPVRTGLAYRLSSNTAKTVGKWFDKWYDSSLRKEGQLAVATGNDEPTEPEMLETIETDENGAVITEETKKNKRNAEKDRQRKLFTDYLEGLTSDKVSVNKLQLFTAFWFCNGSVRLPEDQYKVDQALEIAQNKKVDPHSYSSPMELINAFPNEARKQGAFDLDSVLFFHDKRELANGLVIYTVDDTEECREYLREIINVQHGIDRSPWCLLASDGTGKLMDRSRTFWYDVYNAYPKEAVFHNGTIVSFCANSTKKKLYWDLLDCSHENKIGLINNRKQQEKNSLVDKCTEYYASTGELANRKRYFDMKNEEDRNEVRDLFRTEPENLVQMPDKTYVLSVNLQDDGNTVKSAEIYPVNDSNNRAGRGSFIKYQKGPEGTLVPEIIATTSSQNTFVGPYRSFYNNGAPRLTCNYLPGGKQTALKFYCGKMEYRFKDGSIKKCGMFDEDGNPSGLHLSFYGPDKIRSKTDFTTKIREDFDKEGNRIAMTVNGNVFLYYPSGTLKTTCPDAKFLYNPTKRTKYLGGKNVKITYDESGHEKERTLFNNFSQYYQTRLDANGVLRAEEFRNSIYRYGSGHYTTPSRMCLKLFNEEGLLEKMYLNDPDSPLHASVIMTFNANEGTLRTVQPRVYDKYKDKFYPDGLELEYQDDGMVKVTPHESPVKEMKYYSAKFDDTLTDEPFTLPVKELNYILAQNEETYGTERKIISLGTAISALGTRATRHLFDHLLHNNLPSVEQIPEFIRNAIDEFHRSETEGPVMDNTPNDVESSDTVEYYDENLPFRIENTELNSLIRKLESSFGLNISIVTDRKRQKELSETHKEFNRSGGYNGQTNTLYQFYDDRSDMSEQMIARSTLFHALIHRNLAEAVPGIYDRLCAMTAEKDMGLLSKETASLRRKTSEGNVLIRQYMASGDFSAVEPVIIDLCTLLGIEYDQSYTTAAIKANSIRENAEINRCLTLPLPERDAILSEKISDRLPGLMHKRMIRDFDPISLGLSSPLFAAAGYKDSKVLLDLASFAASIKNSTNLDYNDVKGLGLVSSILQPLAIIKERENEEAKRHREQKGEPYYQRYQIITDIQSSDGKFLVFIATSPEELAYRQRHGKDASGIILSTPKTISQWALLNTISINDNARENNIKALREKVNANEFNRFDIERILSRMEGRTPQELGSYKKNDAVSVQDNSPRLVSQRLNSAANVINNFRNANKLRDIYSLLNQTEPSPAERQVAHADLQVTETAKLPDPSLTLVIDKAISPQYFSDKTYKKMADIGFVTNRDLVGQDPVMLEQWLGKKGARDIAAYLKKWKLNDGNAYVNPMTDNLPATDSEDLLRTINDISPFNGDTYPMPFSSDGSYFNDASVLTLVAKSAQYNTRWEGCGMFLTKEDCAKKHLTIREDAPGTLIRTNAGLVTVYNLADTNLRKTHPKAFLAIVEKSRAHHCTTSFTNILNALRNISTDEMQKLMSYSMNMTSITSSIPEGKASNELFIEMLENGDEPQYRVRANRRPTLSESIKSYRTADGTLYTRLDPALAASLLKGMCDHFGTIRYENNTSLSLVKGKLTLSDEHGSRTLSAGDDTVALLDRLKDRYSRHIRISDNSDGRNVISIIDDPVTGRSVKVSAVLNDLHNILVRPSRPDVQLLHTKQDMVKAVKLLRMENDDRINSVLDKLPDLDGIAPISSMNEQTRLDLARAIGKVMEGYEKRSLDNLYGMKPLSEEEMLKTRGGVLIEQVKEEGGMRELSREEMKGISGGVVLHDMENLYDLPERNFNELRMTGTTVVDAPIRTDRREPWDNGEGVREQAYVRLTVDNGLIMASNPDTGYEYGTVDQWLKSGIVLDQRPVDARHKEVRESLAQAQSESMSNGIKS